MDERVGEANREHGHRVRSGLGQHSDAEATDDRDADGGEGEAGYRVGQTGGALAAHRARGQDGGDQVQEGEGGPEVCPVEGAVDRQAAPVGEEEGGVPVQAGRGGREAVDSREDAAGDQHRVRELVVQRAHAEEEESIFAHRDRESRAEDQSGLQQRAEADRRGARGQPRVPEADIRVDREVEGVEARGGRQEQAPPSEREGAAILLRRDGGGILDERAGVVHDGRGSRQGRDLCPESDEEARVFGARGRRLRGDYSPIGRNCQAIDQRSTPARRSDSRETIPGGQAVRRPEGSGR